MPITRRELLLGAAAAVPWRASLTARGLAFQTAVQPAPLSLFRHGVASGDPLSDRVVLWTRVTPPPARSAIGPIAVDWVLADDERLGRIVARGTVPAGPERDFTAKVDAAGLQAGRTYYYAFTAGGERSPIGRTRTLPAGAAARLRAAVVSCSNYPAGCFNVYRCIANRGDLDLVLHLGDYIYEAVDSAAGGTFGAERAPLAPGVAGTLAEYRQLYATYRTDADLQALHRQHPMVAVWDDHEIANNAWSGGAEDHTATQGSWPTRLTAAYRAYLEWLPIREAAGGDLRLYRSFRAGNLADLIVLDGRSTRDHQSSDAADLNDPRRTMLGERQEAWLFDQLSASMRAGTRWRLLGQQVLFSPATPDGPPMSPDMWDGYPAARRRVLDFLSAGPVRDLAILTGDLHSSWAFDVPRDPWAPRASAAARSLAIELVGPAISSPPLFTDAAIREEVPTLAAQAPHLRYMDGDHNGYVLLDLTTERLRADWYFVPSVMERSARETRAASFVCERGSDRLSPA